MPTLIHEPGSSTANSFLSLARAEELAGEHPLGAAWLAQSDDAKSTQLIRATRLLNRECYTGLASVPGQSLQWPRSGLLSRNGESLDPATIPLDLELATIELAIMMRVPGGAGDPSSPLPEQALQGLTKLKAGPIELGFKATWTEADGLPEHVRGLLVPGWLCPEVEEGTRRLVVWSIS